MMEPRKILLDRIRDLCHTRKAAIFAHNYQRGEVQDLADVTGDSLELARRIPTTDAEVIVFCGVHFMAETAAILCPEKVILFPDLHAGCPMADMATPRELVERKKVYPEAQVVTYINSSAAIKALSDICCTSANAVEVVQTIPPDCPILFVPDRNLGRYVESKLGRKLLLWDGYCPTHERILPEFVRRMKEAHPGALFIAHPECRPETLALADAVGSTSRILAFCRQSSAQEFIIGTEIGLLHRLRKENPHKVFYPATEVADCPSMKLITLEKILWCLEEMAPRIVLDPHEAERARRPIEKMLEVGGGGR